MRVDTEMAAVSNETRPARERHRFGRLRPRELMPIHAISGRTLGLGYRSSEEEIEGWVGYEMPLLPSAEGFTSGWRFVCLLPNPSTAEDYREFLTKVWSNTSEHIFPAFISSPENASDIESPPTVPSTGRADVDARLLLWRVRNLDAAVELARRSISAEVADRLTELRNLPYNRSAGEEPLNFESVQWFLDYCSRRQVVGRPLMTVTPDGTIQGDWRRGSDRWLTIRFFPDGMAWVFIQDGTNRGSCRVSASKLLTDECMIQFPDWA